MLHLLIFGCFEELWSVESSGLKWKCHLFYYYLTKNNFQFNQSLGMHRRRDIWISGATLKNKENQWKLSLHLHSPWKMVRSHLVRSSLGWRRVSSQSGQG